MKLFPFAIFGILEVKKVFNSNFINLSKSLLNLKKILQSMPKHNRKAFLMVKLNLHSSILIFIYSVYDATLFFASISSKRFHLVDVMWIDTLWIQCASEYSDVCMEIWRAEKKICNIFLTMCVIRTPSGE